MWWNAGPHLRRNLLIESGQHETRQRTRKSFFQANSDADEFRAILISKFGSITRAWRNGLDADDNGYLDFVEFSTAARMLGCTGHLRTLWYNLDLDDSGSITLNELDAPAAAMLEKFRVRSTSKYGSMQALWTKLLDQDGSKTVSFAEFAAHVGELGYSENEEIWDLFNLLLVRPGGTYLVLEDLMFLQKWEEQKRKKMFRKRVNSRWINRDPNIRGEVRVPRSICDSASEDYPNLVGNNIERMQEDFKRHLIARFGSLSRAFDAMDTDGNGSLSLNEFQTCVATVLEYCRFNEAARLFVAFNGNLETALTWNQLGITRQEWIGHQLDKETDSIRRRQCEIREVSTSPTALVNTSRRCVALTRHKDRVRQAMPKTGTAFSARLPPGWGLPPHFDPLRTAMERTTLPPFTAR